MATTTPAPNGAFDTFAPPNPSNVANRLSDISSLSLANGMTAGVGDNDPTFDSNPPLLGGAPGGAAINPYGGDPNWPINRVGVMRNAPFSLPDGKQYSLYFIFNPTQIGVSFATNQGSIPPAYLYGQQGDLATATTGPGTGGNFTGTASAPAADVAPNLTSGQSVSWSLFFDRTYDMMYSVNPSENRGVLKDTAALYALMGTFETQGAVPVSTLVQVVFGQTSSGQLWGFTGYITSVQITYGIFRYDMIPSRCEVDLQMMTTYLAPFSPASGGAGGGSVTVGNTTVPVGTAPQIANAGATQGF